MSEFMNFVSKKTKSAEERFIENMSESDVFNLKKFAFKKDEDISIAALVSMVLFNEANKPIDNSVKEELLIRDLLNEDCSLSEKGLEFIERESTKERIKGLL